MSSCSPSLARPALATALSSPAKNVLGGARGLGPLQPRERELRILLHRLVGPEVPLGALQPLHQVASLEVERPGLGDEVVMGMVAALGREGQRRQQEQQRKESRGVASKISRGRSAASGDGMRPLYAAWPACWRSAAAP